MALTKLITGKLPPEDFVRSYDFTRPDTDWFPVKENVDEEIVEIPSDVSKVIRKYVEEKIR